VDVVGEHVLPNRNRMRSASGMDDSEGGQTADGVSGRSKCADAGVLGRKAFFCASRTGDARFHTPAARGRYTGGAEGVGRRLWVARRVPWTMYVATHSGVVEWWAGAYPWRRRVAAGHGLLAVAAAAAGKKVGGTAFRGVIW